MKQLLKTRKCGLNYVEMLLFAAIVIAMTVLHHKNKIINDAINNPAPILRSKA